MRKLSNTVGMASLDMGIMKCGGGEGRRELVVWQVKFALIRASICRDQVIAISPVKKPKFQ